MGLTVISNRNSIGRINLIQTVGQLPFIGNPVAISIKGLKYAIQLTRTAMKQIPLGRNTIGGTFFPE